MLSRNQLIIKEHVGMFKLSDAYDIIDPTSGKVIGLAQERVSGFMQVLRLVIDKKMLPTSVVFIDQPDAQGQGTVVLSIRRGFTFLRSKVSILVNDRDEIGYFKSKLFTIGGGFNIFDKQDRKVGEVKGNWTGWEFKMVDDNKRELGTVSKKWAGMGKELFTSADTYVISISPDAPADASTRALLLAAGIAIDTVFKEGN